MLNFVSCLGKNHILISLIFIIKKIKQIAAGHFIVRFSIIRVELEAEIIDKNESILETDLNIK